MRINIRLNSSFMIFLFAIFASLQFCYIAEADTSFPELHIGDTWSVKGQMAGNYYSIKSKVTSQDTCRGIPCYTIDITFDPPMQGNVITLRTKVDKKTRNTINVKELILKQDSNYRFIQDVYYENNETMFPLMVGKTWNETIKTVSRVLFNNDEIEKNQTVESYIYKVVSYEKYHLEEGSFDSYKVEKYSTDNKLMSISWYSPVHRYCEIGFKDTKGNNCKLSISEFK